MTRGMDLYEAAKFRGCEPVNAALLAVQFGNYDSEWGDIDKLADGIEAQVVRGKIVFLALGIPGKRREADARARLQAVIGKAAVTAILTAASEGMAAAE